MSLRVNKKFFHKHQWSTDLCKWYGICRELSHKFLITIIPTKTLSNSSLNILQFYFLFLPFIVFIRRPPFSVPCKLPCPLYLLRRVSRHLFPSSYSSLSYSFFMPFRYHRAFRGVPQSPTQKLRRYFRLQQLASTSLHFIFHYSCYYILRKRPWHKKLCH